MRIVSNPGVIKLPDPAFGTLLSTPNNPPVGILLPQKHLVGAVIRLVYFYYLGAEDGVVDMLYLEFAIEKFSRE